MQTNDINQIIQNLIKISEYYIQNIEEELKIVQEQLSIIKNVEDVAKNLNLKKESDKEYKINKDGLAIEIIYNQLEYLITECNKQAGDEEDDKKREELFQIADKFFPMLINSAQMIQLLKNADNSSCSSGGCGDCNGCE